MAGYDEFGSGRGDYGPVSGPERGPIRSTIFHSLSAGSLREGVREGVIPHEGPVHSQYASEAVRLSTFSDWPPGLRQKKEDMAAAGLFYIGRSDQVKCYYCDGGLKEWQEEDDPWVEHAGWFSHCGFVRLQKGEEFIQKCRVIVNSNLEERKKEKERNNNSIKRETESIAGPSTEERSSPCSPPGGSRCSTTEEIQTENDTMRRQMQCKVCFNADVGVVFLPCGHLVVCTSCAPNLRTCAVCRAKINETIKVYMS